MLRKQQDLAREIIRIKGLKVKECELIDYLSSSLQETESIPLKPGEPLDHPEG